MPQCLDCFGGEQGGDLLRRARHLAADLAGHCGQGADGERVPRLLVNSSQLGSGLGKPGERAAMLRAAY